MAYRHLGKTFSNNPQRFSGGIQSKPQYIQKRRLDEHKQKLVYLGKQIVKLVDSRRKLGISVVKTPGYSVA